MRFSRGVPGMRLWNVGVPYGSRTRVAAVKGRCPRPLDERDALSASLTGKRTCYGSVGEKVVSNRGVSRARFVIDAGRCFMSQARNSSGSVTGQITLQAPGAVERKPLDHSK